MLSLLNNYLSLLSYTLALRLQPVGAPLAAFCGCINRFACLGRQKETIKKIEKHGALDLGGRHLVATHNNQPIVSRSGRGDVGEKARWG